MRYSAAFAALLFALAGCGGDEEPLALPEEEYVLVVTDSLGVEIGEEEYMFAGPLYSARSPSGEIAVIDMMKHSVMFFSEEGEYLLTAGDEGEGPGQFQYPSNLNFFPDGGFLVRDSRGVHMFDANHDFVERHLWDSYNTPVPVRVLEDGGFAGIQQSMDTSDGNMMFTIRVGKWLPGEQDPEVEYFSREFEFRPNPGVLDDTENRGRNIYACATGDGRVFCAISSIDEFRIWCFEPDGTEYLVIEDESIGRTAKTPEELDDELDDRTSMFRHFSGDPNRELPEIRLDPYRHTIRSIFTDGGDRLWVRLGSYPGAVFRVYDTDGEVLFHAKLDRDCDPVELNHWAVHCSGYGFTATNTSTRNVQKVYLLELRPASSHNAGETLSRLSFRP